MNTTIEAEWQARRLAWAREEAETRREPDAWRYLGDLAAALGDFPLALGAHRRSGKVMPVAKPEPPAAPPAAGDLDRRLQETLAAAEAATAALEVTPSPVAPARRKRGRPRKKASPTTGSEAAPAPAATAPAAAPSADAWRVRLKAAAPQARRAWLEKMLTGAGGRLLERPDGLWCELPESGAGLALLLRRHPELEE